MWLIHYQKFGICPAFLVVLESSLTVHSERGVLGRSSNLFAYCSPLVLMGSLRLGIWVAPSETVSTAGLIKITVGFGSRTIQAPENFT